MGKVVVAAAVNGNRMDTEGAFIPVTPDEIASDARECAEAGATVVRFHARDAATRRSTGDIAVFGAVFGAVVSAIRASCDVLVETTTAIGPVIDAATGRPAIDPATGSMKRHGDAERVRLLDVDPPQDLCSVAAGSLNMHTPVYGETVVFVNPPRYIHESLAKLARKVRTGFQFDVFDLGFLGAVSRLVAEGRLRPGRDRFWLNYILGFGGLPPEAHCLDFAVAEGRRLFPGTPWGVVAPAQWHFPMAAHAAATGADCLRTGFEDAVHLPHGAPAGRNARMVEALVRLVRAAGREIAAPDEARRILGLA